MKVKNHISSTELFFVLVHTMLGVGILSLPYETSKAAGKDGWISIILTGFIIQCIVLFIWLLCSKFPNLTLYDFSKVILGKALGTILNIFYILYFTVVVSYIFIRFTDILKRWVLPETPALVLILLGILILIYGGIGTIRNMVSLFSFLFLFILLFCILKLLTFYNNPIDFRYLFPIGSSEFRNILEGTNEIFISFLGYETLLIYYAFVKQPKKISAMKGAFSAVFFIGLMFLFIVILNTVMLSPQEIKHTPEPVLYILSASNINIVSRLDLIFLSVWGFIVFTTFISYTYSASMGISKLIRVKHSVSVFIFALFVFFISTIFIYMEHTIPDNWMKLVIFIFGLTIPIILLGITIIFKRAEVASNEKN